MPHDPHAPTGGAAARPLVLTGDEDLLDELLRIAATAGVELDVAADAAGARRRWLTAPMVVVSARAVPGCRRLGLPRRAGVCLLGEDLDDAGVWQEAVEVGAERVLFLPDAEPWLATAFSDAAEGTGADGALVAVVGGRGGAGATTLAAALAVSAGRAGHTVLLIDADPLGGGIDLVFGAEDDGGLRWPDLTRTRGRVPAAALAEALPRMAGLSVLSWDRSGPGRPGPEPFDQARPATPGAGLRQTRTGSRWARADRQARRDAADDIAIESSDPGRDRDPGRDDDAAMAAVLAAGRRVHDLLVVDLPRNLDDAARTVLADADLVLLIVPAEVRAAAAAGQVAAAVGLLCRDLRVVVRTPGPGGLDGPTVAEALGLPLQGELRAEPGIARALERGEPPARRGRGPLAQLCGGLLDELLVAQPGLGRSA